ncbi:MAG: phage tail protein [Gammaproteobacteria bacterium]|nr:phage tail protein [Gammaproteobacteria bacterium]
MPDNLVISSHFVVNWGGNRIGFSEVSGLGAEVQFTEYREGADPHGSTRKLPGLKKYGNIILKRGIASGDNDFYEWFQTLTVFSVERRDITLSLLNEEHEPVVTWKIIRAFPVKIEGPVMNAKNGEVAIETLELTHEGLVIENG